MRRYVRRGATGIAIIDNSGSRPFLRYVFDVADTGGGEETRPKLWKYREEYQDTVSAALEQRFDVSGAGLMDRPEKVTAEELVRQFSWAKVPKNDVVVCIS